MEPFGGTPPNEDPNSTGLAFGFNERFGGWQYFDAETGNFFNWSRDYWPDGGRYVESDPIGLRGGLNTYFYVLGNPLRLIDPKGLSGSNPGGPYHPPVGVGTRCTRFDPCPTLKAKMWLIQRMIDSHQGWDWNNPAPMGGGRHSEEIEDLWRAFARCQSIYQQKCTQTSCPTTDPASVVTGFGVLGVGVACALAPELCVGGAAAGGFVGGLVGAGAQ